MNLTNEGLSVNEDAQENLKENIGTLVKEGVALMLLSRLLLTQIANAKDGKIEQEAISNAEEMLKNTFSSPENFLAAQLMEEAMKMADEMSSQGG